MGIVEMDCIGRLDMLAAVSNALRAIAPLRSVALQTIEMRPVSLCYEVTVLALVELTASGDHFRCIVS